jgi:hypothetical protein
MKNEPITPIDHGFFSGSATTIAESGKGGFWTAIKGAFIGAAAFFGFWTVGGATVGAIAGAAGAGIAIITGFAAAPTFGAGLLAFAAATGVCAVAGGSLGAVLGAISGITGAFAGTVIGGVIGLGGGALHGMHKVGQEKGAAQAVQAQLEAYKAQLAAMENIAKASRPANDNKYNFPPQGDALNQAPTNIKVGRDSAELQGKAAATDLQQQMGA